MKNYPLIETICIRDGVVQHLKWHQWRYEKSFFALYGVKSSDNLLPEELLIPHEFRKGLCKLRVRYNKTSKKNELEKYEVKIIETLKIVFDNTIEYNLKYADRAHLKQLYNKRGICDDVLVVKNDVITDSSYCNIVFWDGEHWITPSKPLLGGTARERLIHTGIIIDREIRIGDLPKFESFRLINAMRAFEEVRDSDIRNIIYEDSH